MRQAEQYPAASLAQQSSHLTKAKLTVYKCKYHCTTTGGWGGGSCLEIVLTGRRSGLASKLHLNTAPRQGGADELMNKQMSRQMDIKCTIYVLIVVAVVLAYHRPTLPSSAACQSLPIPCALAKSLGLGNSCWERQLSQRVDHKSYYILYIRADYLRRLARLAASKTQRWTH